MKEVAYVSALLLALFIASCETTTGPVNTPQPPVSVTTLFVGQQAHLTIPLPQPAPANVYPEAYEQNDWLYPYCYVDAYFSDTSRAMLRINLYASNLTPAPLTGVIKIALGDDTIYQPATISIIDFYYASYLDNNTNDTIKLRSGISFLLQLTCRDTAGNIVSENQIGRLLLGNAYGYIVFPYSYYSYDAIFCDTYQKDTTSYYYVFSTIPNVTFSSQDTGQYFRMQISNKIFTLPIRLVN